VTSGTLTIILITVITYMIIYLFTERTQLECSIEHQLALLRCSPILIAFYEIY